MAYDKDTYVDSYGSFLADLQDLLDEYAPRLFGVDAVDSSEELAEELGGQYPSAWILLVETNDLDPENTYTTSVRFPRPGLTANHAGGICQWAANSLLG